MRPLHCTAVQNLPGKGLKRPNLSPKRQKQQQFQRFCLGNKQRTPRLAPTAPRTAPLQADEGASRPPSQFGLSFDCAGNVPVKGGKGRISCMLRARGKHFARSRLLSSVTGFSQLKVRRAPWPRLPRVAAQTMVAWTAPPLLGGSYRCLLSLTAVRVFCRHFAAGETPLWCVR